MPSQELKTPHATVAPGGPHSPSLEIVLLLVAVVSQKCLEDGAMGGSPSYPHVSAGVRVLCVCFAG